MLSLPYSARLSAASAASDHAERGLGQLIPVRQRPDLVIGSAGNGNWTIKDPLTQQFYHLRAEEYFIWQQLNGLQTWADLIEQFERQFAPQKLDAVHLANFVQSLSRQGLVLSDRVPESHGRTDQNICADWLRNPLAIRLRGVDPQSFLQQTLPWVRWIFSSLCVLLTLAGMLVTLPIVLAELPQLEREIQQASLQLGSSWPLLMLALAVVKICHELGHGYACVKLGGECRELGVMFLLGTPCLYCNVSDAWLFPSRWQRAAVSAAGIYVELILATLAGWIWLASAEGAVHQIALHIMLIGSLNTLLLNGNPLLRYDGYYVLSDLLNIPNLRTRSQQALRQFLNSLLFGQASDFRTPFPRHTRLLLITYGLLSTAYMWLVIGSIAALLYLWLSHWRLGALAVVVCGLFLVSRVGGAMQQGVATWRHAGLTSQGLWGKGRWWLGTGLIPVVIVLLAFIPLPRCVLVPVQIIAAKTETIVVTTPGFYVSNAAEDRQRAVAAESDLFRLDSPELERRQIELRYRLQRQQRRLELLDQRLAREPELAAQVSLTEAIVHEQQELIEHQNRQAEALTLKSRHSGVLIPAIAQPMASQSNTAPRRLSVGLPSDGSRIWLPERTEIARVVGPRRSAVLYVPQDHLPDIASDMSVSLSIPQAPHETLTACIVRIAATPLINPPSVLITQSSLPLKSTPESLKFASPVHEVRVEFEADQRDELLLGQVGTGRIELPAQPLWKQCLTLLRQTFPVLN